MKCRLTVVEQVYYNGPDKQPTGFSHYYCSGAADEQPFHRELTIGAEPVFPMEKCWLASASLLCIVFPEPVWQRQPTAAERQAAFAKRVIVSVGEMAFAELQPGESLRVRPLYLTSIAVRSNEGTAKVIVHAFPD